MIKIPDNAVNRSGDGTREKNSQGEGDDQADEAHARYVQKIEEVNGVKEELNDVVPQIVALRDGLKVADLKVAERRRMSGEQRAESMRQEAIRKMESGEKLTFEDLRLIYGDDEDDDTEVLDRS